MFSSPSTSIQTLSLCLQEREREVLYTGVQDRKASCGGSFTGVPVDGVVLLRGSHAEMIRVSWERI